MYPCGQLSGFSSTGIYRRRYNFKERINIPNSYASCSYFIDFNQYLISGQNLPTQVQMLWEHPNASGLGKIMSGMDLNPYNNSRETSILFIG